MVLMVMKKCYAQLSLTNLSHVPAQIYAAATKTLPKKNLTTSIYKININHGDKDWLTVDLGL